MASKQRTKKRVTGKYVVNMTLQLKSKKLTHAAAMKLKRDIKKKNPRASVSIRKA